MSAGEKMAFQHFQNVCVREMWVVFYHRPPLNLKITGDLLGSEGSLILFVLAKPPDKENIACVVEEALFTSV